MNIKVVKVRTDKEMYDAVLEGNIPVLDSDKELYKILEEVGKSIDDDEIKYNLKVCKNIRFSRDLMLYVDGNKERSFRELYEFVDYYYRNKDVFSSDRHENKFRNVYLVFGFDEEKEKDAETVKKFKEEFFDTIQQLIYLDIHMDVYTKGFLEKKRIVEEFKKERWKFEELVYKAMDEIDSLIANTKDTEEIKSIALENLHKIGELLYKLESEIKVAIFATKKTGKSMVVNGLIGEELAPTSLELPTPCNILFKPIEENKIIVRDEKEEREFTNAYEVKNYLKEKFEKVKEEGHKISDIEISYPYKMYKTKKYMIYDTPGPDLATKERSMGHGEVYKTALSNSDVAVFIIDYTKYAQQSEVDLLESIREEFKNRDMVLICAVNKIDEVFSDADSEKMPIRIADFIRAKYKSMGYRNIIVIPISAMTYFYMQKLADRFPEVKGEDFAGALERIKSIIKAKEESQKEYKTYLAFIRGIAGSLETIYDIEVSYESIINFSGFELFRRYVEQVVFSKAEVDRVYNVITKIGIHYNAIKNEIENRLNILKSHKSSIENLSKEIEEFEKEDLKDIKQEIESLIEKLKGKEKELKKDVRSTLKKSFKRVENNSKKALKNNLKEIRNKFSNDDKYKDIISNSSTLDKFLEEFRKSLLEVFLRSTGLGKHIKDGINALLEEISKQNEDINKEIEDLINKLREKVLHLNKKAKEILHGEDKAIEEEEFKDMLSLPIFKPEIGLSEIESFIEKILEDYKNMNVDAFTSNFKEKVDMKTKGLKNWLRKLIFKEDIVRELKEDFVSGFEGIKDEIEDIHENYISELEDKLEEEIDNLYSEIEKHFKDFRGILEEYYKSSFSVIGRIKDDAKREEKDKQRIIDMLERVYSSVKPLKDKLEAIAQRQNLLEDKSKHGGKNNNAE